MSRKTAAPLALRLARSGLPQRAALLSALAMVACAGPSSSNDRRARAKVAQVLPDGATQVDARQIRGIHSETREARLSTAPAERYGSPAKHALNPGETQLLELLSGKGLRHEPGLSRVARELARTAPDRFNMPSALIDGLMGWAGMVEPPPRIGIVEIEAPCDENPDAEGCTEAMSALVEELAMLGEPSGGDDWIGVGIHRAADGTSRFIVARTERTVALEPLPVEVGEGATITLKGRLIGGRENPRVEVIDPAGEWQQSTLRGGKTRGSRFSAEVRCLQPGGHRIEVLADGPHGPEIAANFTVYCGVQAPRTVTYVLEHIDPDIDVGAIERANFDAVNRARTQRGLRPLQWDNAAAAVARAHSQDMVDNDFMGHRSPTTGMAGDRFERSGIRVVRLRENVGRGYGPVTIHEALMNSPGHRINVLAEDVPRVGIGAVIGAPETTAAGAPRPIFITQNFLAPPEAAPKDPRAELRRRVTERRDRAKLAPITWDPALDPMAQRLAEGIARGDEQAARKALNAEFQASAYAAIKTQQVMANDFSAFPELDFWDEAKLADGLGSGVAEVTQGPKKGSLLLIVLMADMSQPKKR